MNIYEFWGTKRSGNHAILEWIINNLVDYGDRRQYINSDPHDFSCRDLVFVNCYHLAKYKKDILRAGIKLKPKNLLISYEDEKASFSAISQLESKKYTIVRNLENVVASRLAGNFVINDNFFEVWENHVRASCFKIHYEKWLIDSYYRESIANSMNVIDKNIINQVSKAGGGSSFVGLTLDQPERLLLRYTQVRFPEEIKEKVIYYSKRNPEFSNYQDL